MARLFSQEDIEKIRQTLSETAVPDSAFTPTDECSENDDVVVLQNGQNRLLGISILTKQIASNAKTYSGDGKEIVSTDDGKKVVFNIGKIPIEKVEGAEQLLSGIIKGITITSKDTTLDLKPNDGGKVNIKLGSSLDIDGEGKINIVWNN